MTTPELDWRPQIQAPSDLAQPRILVIEALRVLYDELRPSLPEFNVAWAGDVHTAAQFIENHRPEIVWLCADAVTGRVGIQYLHSVLDSLSGEGAAPRIIASSESGSEKLPQDVFELDIQEFLAHEPDIEECADLIRRTWQLRQLEQPRRLSGAGWEAWDFHGLLTNDPVMQSIFSAAARAARSSLSVLIEGESGTGKESLARVIHLLGANLADRFTRLRTSVEDEAEASEEVEGYWNEAVNSLQLDLYEGVNVGRTLYVEEVASLSPAMQASLADVLHRREPDTEVSTGRYAILRIMAATRFDLWDLVREGKIREDLYFGLMQLQLRVPPLRARESDALMLSSHFLEKHARLNNRPAHAFSDRALTMISEYAWPGNVRELEGRIKRAAIMADSAIIGEQDLDFGPLAVSFQRRTLRDIRAEAERKAIKETLTITNGNVSRAARILNISRPTLYGLMTQLGIRNLHGTSTVKRSTSGADQG